MFKPATASSGAARAASPRPPGATAERILDATERCMRRLGMARFSMADVAAAAGLSRGAVYFHFPDRDALVRAALARAAERFVRDSEQAVRARRTLAAQVAEAAVYIRRRLRDEPQASGVAGESDTLLATLLTAHLEGVVASWVDFWQPYLAAAAARGEIRRGIDRREAAEWIVRIMLSLVVMPSAVVDLDDLEAVRGYVSRYIVQGLAPRASSDRRK
ncbi:MAG TPA: helix-turn-helix domain-containing protein [Candidatus Binatia bacterium]